MYHKIHYTTEQGSVVQQVSVGRLFRTGRSCTQRRIPGIVLPSAYGGSIPGPLIFLHFSNSTSMPLNFLPT